MYMSNCPYCLCLSASYYISEIENIIVIFQVTSLSNLFLLSTEYGLRDDKP